MSSILNSQKNNTFERRRISFYLFVKRQQPKKNKQQENNKKTHLNLISMEYNVDSWQVKYEHNIKRYIDSFYKHKPYHVIGPSDYWVFKVNGVRIFIFGDHHDNKDTYTVKHSKEMSTTEMVNNIRNKTHIHISEWILLYLHHHSAECCDIFTEHVNTTKPHHYKHPSHISQVLNMFYYCTKQVRPSDSKRQQKCYDKFPNVRYHMSDVRLYKYSTQHDEFYTEVESDEYDQTDVSEKVDVEKGAYEKGGDEKGAYEKGDDEKGAYEKVHDEDNNNQVRHFYSILTYILNAVILSDKSALQYVLSYFQDDGQFTHRLKKLLLLCRKQYQKSMFNTTIKHEAERHTTRFYDVIRKAVEHIHAYDVVSIRLYTQYLCSDLYTLCRMFRSKWDTKKLNRHTKSRRIVAPVCEDSAHTSHIITYTGRNHSLLYAYFITHYFQVIPCNDIKSSIRAYDTRAIITLSMEL